VFAARYGPGSSGGRFSLTLGVRGGYGPAMKARPKKKARDTRPKTVLIGAVEENGLRHEQSPTAVAAEALRTGLIPPSGRRSAPEIPHEDDTIRVGDPDDDSLANEYVGADTPGGSSSTPDQSSVDEIGRAYGLQDEDTGSLRSGAEVLSRRDRHRSELKAPKRQRP
jgi:hypothetical protein